MGQDFSEGDDHPLQREGLSRRWILRACEDSLRRLQVDYIDLYQAHYIDPRTPIEETLSAFTDLVRKGYVRYIGCSNFSAWRLTGKYRRNQALPAGVRAEGNKQRMSEQNFDIVEKLTEVAQRHDSTPTRVALAWLLAQPFVTAPIIGANSTGQLADSMGASELVLSEEEIGEISNVADWKRSRTDREA
jgi:aryl-alcohol dehydrogenase-like predicted oxidoreductase